jgi:sugar/nucleoside kinase (ribokinase family)
MEKKFDIIAIGSACLDIVEEVSDIMQLNIIDRKGVEKKYTAIEHSTKLNVKAVKYLPGGSAANISCDTALLGFKNVYVGKLGEDNSGDVIFQDLTTRNVNTDYIIHTQDAGTAVSIILMVSGQRDRSILAYKGANDLLQPEEIPEELFTKAKILVWTSLTTESATNAILKAIDLARKNKMLVVGAPSMSILMVAPEKAKKIIAKTDVLSFNDEELETLVGSAGTVYQQLERVHQMGVKLVSVTMGSKGSILSDGKKIVETGIYKIEVADTTGAGDAFASGVIFGYTKGYDLETTAKIASCMGAMEVATWGARKGLPASNESLMDFINKHKITQTVRNL